MFAAMAQAQPPLPKPPMPPTPAYQPAVPVASTFNTYGGYGGYGYGGGTAAGSAMQGMASVISAQGNYNLATSAAAINMTQAQRNHIQNRQLWTNTYFEMRATQRAAVAAERGPPPTKEQLVRLASEGAPKPLASTQVDPVTGKVHWPDLLQDSLFDQERSTVEQLLAKQAQYGRLGLSDQNQAGAAIEGMSARLKDQIKNVPAQQYVDANGFLKSLMYSVTKTQL
jgi:hypothetical protein